MVERDPVKIEVRGSNPRGGAKIEGLTNSCIHYSYHL